MRLITILFSILLICVHVAYSDSACIFQIRPIADDESKNGIKMADRKGKEYWVLNEVLATEKDLEKASAVEAYVPKDTYKLNLVFRKDAQNSLSEITKTYLGKRLAMIIDGKLISAGQVMEPIEGDTVSVWGDFSKNESEEFANFLNSNIRKTR